MEEPGNGEVTQLLSAWGAGDETALEKLAPLVYDGLRRLARHYMAGERPGHTLQATALVNEAYLRMVDLARIEWRNRAQFFAIAAQMMRRILVDFARSHSQIKRGGGAHRTALDQALLVSAEPDRNLVALDDALRALAALDPRKAQIVEMRFFGGIEEKEIAGFLNVSVDTVQRDWKAARAWLYRELKRTT